MPVSAGCNAGLQTSSESPAAHQFNRATEAYHENAPRQCLPLMLLTLFCNAHSAMTQVEHFRGMLQRNNSNKELAAQIRATLTQAQGQVQTAQSELARMQRSVKGGENAAKFLKF